MLRLRCTCLVFLASAIGTSSLAHAQDAGAVPDSTVSPDAFVDTDGSLDPTLPTADAGADLVAGPDANHRDAAADVPEHSTPIVASAAVRSADTPRADGPSDDAREDGVMVIGSSLRSLVRVPGSASVLSERDMRRSGPLNVGEAMRRVPGVFVRDEEGQGLRMNVSLRGLDGTRSRRVLMLEDGIPIALNPYGEPDAYYVPPVQRVARIEVIRGSGSILYGPQTIGGVINLVTPAPPLRESGSVVVSGGLPLQYSLHATYGRTVGNAGFIVSLLRREGAGFRSMPFEITDVFARAILRFGPASQVIARIGFYDEGSASTYLGLTGSMYARDPTQNPAPHDWLRMRRYTAAVIHEWRIAPDFRLRSQVYGYMTDRSWHRQQYEREPAPGYLYARIVGDQSIPRGAIYLLDSARSNARQYWVAGAETRLQATFRFARWWRNELDVGIRALGERGLLRVLVGRGENARSGDLMSEEQRDGLALAGYVQERAILFDRLHIVGGARLETYAYERRFRRVEEPSTGRPVDVDSSGRGTAFAVIPGVSVSYVTPVATVFGGIHRGYAPPRVSVAVGGSPAVGQLVDRQLAAEMSVNYEIGARFDVGGWFRGEATAFALDFQNEIIPGTYAGGNPRSEYVNGGTSRYLGLEASAQFDFGRLARVPTNPYLGLRYALIDGRFTSNDPGIPGDRTNGNLVPYAVPHTFEAVAGLEHAAGFQAQASVVAVSDHFADRANTVAQSADGTVGLLFGYATVSARAGYRHRGTGLGVALDVRNAFDARYIASRLPDGIFPGPFRQVILTIRLER